MTRKYIDNENKIWKTGSHYFIKEYIPGSTIYKTRPIKKKEVYLKYSDTIREESIDSNFSTTNDNILKRYSELSSKIQYMINVLDNGKLPMLYSKRLKCLESEVEKIQHIINKINSRVDILTYCFSYAKIANMSIDVCIDKILKHDENLYPFPQEWESIILENRHINQINRSLTFKRLDDSNIYQDSNPVVSIPLKLSWFLSDSNI